MTDHSHTNGGEHRPPPQSAADARDEPYYIESECGCGTALVLYDEYHDTDDPIWYDEWWCPDCNSGLHLDVPPSYLDEIVRRAESAEFASKEEIQKAFLSTPEDDDE